MTTVFVDILTNWLDTTTCNILQIAAVNSLSNTEFNMYIDTAIPTYITEITTLRRKKDNTYMHLGVARECVTIDIAIAALNEFIADADYLVAHNGHSYVFPVLQRYGLLVNKKTILQDIVSLKLHKDNALKPLCKKYNIVYDSRCALQCVHAICNIYKNHYIDGSM